MKKLSILLIGLLLVSGLAFASDEFAGTPATDIDITASVTWGVDLNSGATGFQNAASFDAELYWLNDDDDTDFDKGGDDGLYGYIFVDDVYFEFDGGAWLLGYDYISASVFVDPAEIIIYAAPGMSWGNATALETGDADVAPALAAANTIGGVTIELADLADMATVDVYVVSDGDWTTNVANDYAAGVDLSVDVSIVTVSVGGFYGWFNDAGTYGGTALLEVALDALEGVDVSVGADLVEGVTWEVAANATLNFSEANDDDDTANLAFDVFYSEAADLDAKVSFAEPTDLGLADMVGASVALELFDLTSDTIVWNVDVTGEYDTGDVMPYFGFGMGTDEVVDLNVGVELYAGLTGIDNTTITLDYVSTDLTDPTQDLGIITVDVAISF
jgi:hypothetical protein